MNCTHHAAAALVVAALSCGLCRIVAASPAPAPADAASPHFTIRVRGTTGVVLVPDSQSVYRFHVAPPRQDAQTRYHPEALLVRPEKIASPPEVGDPKAVTID